MHRKTSNRVILHVPSSFCDLSNILHHSGHSHISTPAGVGLMKTDDKANWDYEVRITADIFYFNVCRDKLHDEL